MARKRALSGGLFGPVYSASKRGARRLAPYGGAVARGARAVGSRILSRSALGAAGKVASYAGKAVPYVGAAMSAYEAGKMLYGAFKKKPRRVGAGVTGSYRGSFKKTSKKSKGLQYANKGVQETHEVHGTVEDPNCVYITHVGVDAFRLIQQVGQAILRKLFEKGGNTIVNIDDPLPTISINSSQNQLIEMTTINGKTGVETVLASHRCAVGDSLRIVAGIFNDEWLNYSSGFNNIGNGAAGVDTTHPHRFILYHQDFNTTIGDVMRCELFFADEIMCVQGTSEMKIQNRTNSASGTTSTDDVSANPVIGRRYTFSSIPKLRDKRGFKLASVPVANGVQLVRAAEILSSSTNAAVNLYSEPPVPNLFSNCTASSKLYIGPGAIKSGKVYYRKSMNFLKFLETIRLQYGTAPEFYCYTTIFPCEMYAVEDLINVNPTQNIRLAYECNKTLGVYFKTRKRTRPLTSFIQQTFNNIPV
nr:MAG: putative capsid protein [Cressdnaviricota sp.]